jgi:hypothetical protein
MKYIKVLYANDGQSFYDAISQGFAGFSDIIVDGNADILPDSYESAVAVVVMSIGAMSDQRLATALERIVEKDIQIIPLVEELENYCFSDIPDSLKVLGERNAIGWNDTAKPGEALFHGIKLHIGLSPFKRERKFFISYRRYDGQDTAAEIYDYFSSKGYQVFLDTEDIEAGEKIQSGIIEGISQRDFLLLIDSPKAMESDWIMKEITTALERCVPIACLRLKAPNSPSPPFWQSIPGIKWNPANPDRLSDLEQFISSAIASKTDFDARVIRYVKEVALLYDCNVSRSKPRNMLLTKDINGAGRHLLIEFENAPNTLERLYRLHNSYSSTSPQAHCAFFIHNASKLSELEQNAVRWASGAEPLYVLALNQIVQAVEEAFL